MNGPISKTPNGWLAFELSILHRLKFDTVCLPITGDPAIGYYLRRRGIAVSANDELQSDWYRSLSVIQNTNEQLTDDDVNLVLLDVYVPGNRLANPSLSHWFSETDAWWFDNIRKNIDKLSSPIKFAIAVRLALAVGDYTRSFTEETRDLRQPLSHVFRRLWMGQPEPLHNSVSGTCTNKPLQDAVAEASGELMFLRLPLADVTGTGSYQHAWREEWIRGGNDFWDEFTASAGLTRPVKTKSQYLRDLDAVLSRASHFRAWALNHVDAGTVSAQEIAEVVGKHRAVEAIYTKDLTELTGKKAVMITA